MQVSQIVSEIDSEIERLQQARDLIAGVDGVKTKRRGFRTKSEAAKPAKKKSGKRKLSAEGRRKLSEALKARWADRRKRAATKASK